MIEWVWEVFVIENVKQSTLKIYEIVHVLMFCEWKITFVFIINCF